MNHENYPIVEPGITPIPFFAPGFIRLPEVMELAYTKKQRDYIAQVFHNHYYDIDSGKWRPKVPGQEYQDHHITGAAFIIEQYGCDPNQINPELGFLPITLSKYDHQNKIHEDIGKAIREYRTNPNSIKDAIHRHHELARQGKVFWNNRWDAVMMTTVRKLFARFKAENPTTVYPEDISWSKKHPRL